MTTIHKDEPTPTVFWKRIQSLLKVGIVPIFKRFYDQIIRKHTGAPVWHLSRVKDGLYVGGQHYAHGWDAMQARGITAVVNLREKHHCDQAKGVSGMKYRHFYTVDNTPISQECLEEGARFIDDEIRNGGSVYVHCGVGVGRAPTQAAAYLIYIGYTAEEALRMIKKVRPFVHPTDEQMASLYVFEERVASLREQGLLS
jgi:dual specificity MAP kinase phosphatase